MYCATLVEYDYYTDLRVCFLIVGHTHSSIDQYFSVFSKKITKSAFICSPLAMKYLLSGAHDDAAHRPLVFRRIKVI